MKRNSVLSNSIWAMIQQMTTLIISAVLGIISTRFLGAERSGIISIADSIVVIFSSITWLGINSIIVNEIINDTNNQHIIIWTTIITKIVLTSVMIILLFFLVRRFYRNDVLFGLVFLFVGIGTIFQSYETFVFWMQSKLLVKYVAFVSIVVQIFVFSYQLYIIVTKKDVLWFSAVSLIYNFLCFWALFFIYIFLSHSKPTYDFKKLKSIVSKSYHYIISALAITLYMQIDKVMIGKMMSDYHAGIYTVAINVSFLWQFVPIAIINSFRPIILELKKNNDSDYLSLLKALNFLVSVISFVFCIMITLFSDLGIRLLYGAEFSEAAIPLRVSVWATMIAMQGVVRGIWFVAEGFNRFDKYFTCSAAIINMLLNLIFINVWGIVGAAYSTVISYFFEVFLICLLFKETRKYLKWFFLSFVEWKRSINMIKKYVIKKI